MESTYLCTKIAEICSHPFLLNQEGISRWPSENSRRIYYSLKKPPISASVKGLPSAEESTIPARMKGLRLSRNVYFLQKGLPSALQMADLSKDDRPLQKIDERARVPSVFSFSFADHTKLGQLQDVSDEHMGIQDPIIVEMSF